MEFAGGLDNQIWFTNAEADGHKLWAVCLNAKTGKVIHNKLVFEIKSPQKSPVAMNSYASCTPVIEEGRVYVTFGAHGTACSTLRQPRYLAAAG